MTGTQIFEQASSLAPRIQLRDIWFVLKQFGERNLAYCLTPRLVTGRLYFLTRAGREAVKHLLGREVPEPTLGIDWKKYAQVVRGRVRRLILEEVAQPVWHGNEGRTANEIRKRLLERHPVGLNATMRALTELRRLQLTRGKLHPEKPRSRLYVLTPMGRRIVAELRR